MPNRLIDETSPYLLQHANNPVDWYPWGPEAFHRAESEQKPVLMSIGYSACHWCHVMERESFENEAIAELMNANFISIKVDREERPDLDSIYMQAVQALTGRGGWPMTVFLTPEKQPFYGGTYFPPEDRHSMPGFPRVLAAISDAYKNSRNDVLKAANDLTNAIQSSVLAPHSNEELSEELLHDSVKALSQVFDKTYGGFGQAPKFPQPMPLEFLLSYSDRYQDQDSLGIVCETLDAMASGGIYDQLGGGFHRYSTDAQWLTPHFEKMLYDNGLVTQLYLKAYQLTGIPTYQNIVDETLNYMLSEMRHPQGGFYSSQDADTDGEEGKYYLWKESDISSNFEEKDAVTLSSYFGVTPEGNFEGNNILTSSMDTADVADALGLTEQEFEVNLGRIKSHMLAVRSKRTPPPTDRKILTSWNGMVLKALADAALIFDNKRYEDAAIENASFLLQELYIDGRLRRTWKDGTSRLKGYLEDYGYLILGLISLHELTFSHRWLYEANRLTDEMVRLFWDEEQKVLFDVGDDHESLLLRPRELFDNAMASGNSIGAEVLYRMGAITGNTDYLEKAKLLLESAINFMKVYPLGFGHWLKVLTMYLSDNVEIAIVGPKYDENLRSLVRVVAGKFVSNRMFLGKLLDQTHDFPSPLLTGKDGETDAATAYICHQNVCEEPTSDASKLLHQLETRITRSLE